MKKYAILLVFIMVFTVQWQLFAGGNRESPSRHNIYTSVGTTDGFFSPGAVYEGAIGNSFSLGVYAGALIGEDSGIEAFGVEAFLKPRIYFGSSLEKLFIGANLGYFGVDRYDGDDETGYGWSRYYWDDGFVFGLNLGYKFVFGNGSSGFSLEPSIRYDFIPGRFNADLTLGIAFGGRGGAPRPAAPSRVRDGIYIGIVTLGPDAHDITNGPILLDHSGFNTLNRLLETRYQVDYTRPGTALFYATHLALANMKRAERNLPQTLHNVYILTFTDGLDNTSTGLSLPNINDPGNTRNEEFAGGSMANYMRFVKQELDTRQINGTSIEAHVAGVMGIDVENMNVAAFRAALRSLASNDGVVYDDTMLSSFADLQPLFNYIAMQIISRWQVSHFQMDTPSFPRGTKVRMTFGGERTSLQAANARRYVEGEVIIRNREYYLTNIMYNNVISNVGTEVKGELLGSMVRYNFPGFNGVELENERHNIRQFYMDEDADAWQINSEYRSDDSSRTITERNNALIYLVLDQSNSIGREYVPGIRDAVKNFIQVLYNAYN